MRGIVERGLLPAIAVAAATVAAVGWARTPAEHARPVRSISIIDVRPLQLDDPALAPMTSHLFAVRVATTGWALLRYRPEATAVDNRADAGHWRLYLDGRSLGTSYGGSHIGYTPYLTPGTHWIAAELRNIDSSRLSPTVWSEPVILHVPKVIRCWQTGWKGTPETGTPTFGCRPRRPHTEAFSGRAESGRYSTGSWTSLLELPRRVRARPAPVSAGRSTSAARLAAGSAVRRSLRA